MIDEVESTELSRSRPWLAPDFLPLKPTEGAYGYMEGRTLVPSTKEELLAACGPKSKFEVELVWHPDSERLVPVLEVPFLEETHRQRVRASSNWLLAGALINLAGLAIVTLRPNEGPEPFWMSMLVLGVLLPLFEWGYGAWELRRGQHRDPVPLEAARFRVWIGQRRIGFVWTAIGTSALVTLLAFFCGLEASIEKAGLSKAAVFHGEVWRLLSGPLMHGSIPHVVSNLVGIVALGSVVEGIAGRAVTALVLVMSTLAGSVLSCLCLPEIPSVGISGGVMGLLAFLLVLSRQRKELMPAALTKDLLRGLLLSAIIGLVGWEFIDNAAHLGGGLAGAAIGFWIARGANSLPLPRQRAIEIVGHLALALLVIAGVYAGIRVLGYPA